MLKLWKRFGFHSNLFDFMNDSLSFNCKFFKATSEMKLFFAFMFVAFCSMFPIKSQQFSNGQQPIPQTLNIYGPGFHPYNAEIRPQYYPPATINVGAVENSNRALPRALLKPNMIRKKSAAKPQTVYE